MRVSRPAKRLQLKELRRVRIRRRTYAVSSRVVDMPKVGPVQVVFYIELRREGQRLRRRAMKWIVTNRLDWTPRTVLAAYGNRQQIENFFKDTKQHLGLGEYQMRKAEGIQRHWALVVCAHAILQMTERTQRRRSIGQLTARIEDLTQEAAMEWAHRRGLKGLQWRPPFRHVA